MKTKEEDADNDSDDGGGIPKIFCTAIMKLFFTIKVRNIFISSQELHNTQP